MKAALFLTACVLAIPPAIVLGTVAATVFYERVWLKRIAG